MFQAERSSRNLHSEILDHFSEEHTHYDYLLHVDIYNHWDKKRMEEISQPGGHQGCVCVCNNIYSPWGMCANIYK